MADTRDTIDTHLDDLLRVAVRLAEIAVAFNATGNDRIATTLDALSATINEAQEGIGLALNEQLLADVKEAQRNVGSIMTTLLHAKDPIT